MGIALPEMCLAAFTPGQRLWIALAHGARTARAAATARLARSPRRSRAFVPRVGICQVLANGIPCSRRWVVQLRVRFSSRRRVGIAMATARMPSVFPPCLLASGASGTTMSTSSTMAATRPSGVTENSSDLAYSMLLDYISADAGLGNASKGLAFYVRCLRD